MNQLKIEEVNLVLRRTYLLLFRSVLCICLPSSLTFLWQKLEKFSWIYWWVTAPNIHSLLLSSSTSTEFIFIRIHYWYQLHVWTNKRLHISYTQWYINPSTKCNQYIVYKGSYFFILKPLCTLSVSNIDIENSRTCHTILSISYLKQFHSDTATVFFSGDGSSEKQF
jgi:hypothetical protein